MEVYHYLNLQDNYIVAFVDILGFSEIVRNNAETSWMDNTKNGLGINRNGLGINLENVFNNVCGQYTLQNPEEKGVKFLWVSDSIVLSCRKEKINKLLEELEWVLNQLYCAEVGFRGGIAVGKLFHELNIWGTAMVEAVDLEKKANYPCIVIKKYDFKQLDIEVGYSSFFISHPNCENLLFYNYFAAWFARQISQSKSVGSYLSVYTGLIKRNFDECRKDDHKRKWSFLAKQLVSVINDNLQYIYDERKKAIAQNDGSEKRHLLPEEYIEIVSEAFEFGD